MEVFAGSPMTMIALPGLFYWPTLNEALYQPLFALSTAAFQHTQSFYVCQVNF